MIPFISPEYSPKLKLEILLAHQGEFLSTFLNDQFNKGNENSIARGEFNPRGGFSIKKGHIKQFLKARDITSSRPKLLSDIFYFETKKSNVSHFERSARDGTGHSSSFYDLLDDLFSVILRKKLIRSEVEDSLLSPILSISKTVDSVDSLVFDRDKVNKFFGRLYQVSFNSPKEKLEKKAHEYLTQAKTPITNHPNDNPLLSFTNKYLTIKQPGTFDSIEKLCSTKEDIYFEKFGMDALVIGDDISRFKKSINSLLNEFDPFREIFNDFSSLYDQSNSFLNIIESRLGAYKNPESRSSPAETLVFYRKAKREIGALKKIFNNQGKLTDGRTKDENRLTIVSYQAGRVCDFLEQVNRGIVGVDGLRDIYDDIKSFISDVKDQVEKNRSFYKVIIEKNGKLIELVDAESSKVESRIDTDKFFDKTSHLINPRTLIEKNTLKDILLEYGLTVIDTTSEKKFNSRKAAPMIIKDISSLSFSDIYHEISMLKNTEDVLVISDADFEKRKKEKRESEIFHEQKLIDSGIIEGRIVKFMMGVFENFRYSKEEHYYRASNADNNYSMGLLFSEPYSELRANKGFKKLILEHREAYANIQSSLKGDGSTVPINTLFDFAKDHLELNVLQKLQEPLIKGDI